MSRNGSLLPPANPVELREMVEDADNPPEIRLTALVLLRLGEIERKVDRLHARVLHEIGQRE